MFVVYQILSFGSEETERSHKVFFDRTRYLVPDISLARSWNIITLTFFQNLYENLVVCLVIVYITVVVYITGVTVKYGNNC